MMENYDSLYVDMFGLQYSGGLKDSREVYNNNNSMENNHNNNNNYRDPVNNIMGEDGIYSMGMGAAPMMTYQEQDQMPMLGGFNSVNPTTDFGLAPPEQNLQLPPELADMVNSLLLEGGDSFPINDFDQGSLDISIAATDDINCAYDEDDPFGNHSTDGMLPICYENSVPLLAHDPHSALQTPPPQAKSPLPPAAAAPQQRQRRPRKSKTQANAVIAEEMNPMSPALLSYEQYPSPAGDISGVPSPCSSSSGYSDQGIEEIGGKKPRQRRPRVSYSTLTEEEKYKRIRELNNEASRHYRERQRTVLSTLEDQLPSLLEKNQHLKNKALALERLRDQMKHYSDSFLKQNMQ